VEARDDELDGGDESRVRAALQTQQSLERRMKIVVEPWRLDFSGQKQYLIGSLSLASDNCDESFF
jgi:hypothetical protein